MLVVPTFQASKCRQLDDKHVINGLLDRKTELRQYRTPLCTMAGVGSIQPSRVL